MSALASITRYPPPPASLLACEGAAVWRTAVDNAAPHSEQRTGKPNCMTGGGDET